MSIARDLINNLIQDINQAHLAYGNQVATFVKQVYPDIPPEDLNSLVSAAKTDLFSAKDFPSSPREVKEKIRGMTQKSLERLTHNDLFRQRLQEKGVDLSEVAKNITSNTRTEINNAATSSHLLSIYSGLENQGKVERLNIKAQDILKSPTPIIVKEQQPEVIPRGWNALQYSSKTGQILNRPTGIFTASTISNPDLFTPFRLPLSVGFDVADHFTGGKLSANVAAYSLIAQNPEDVDQTLKFLARDTWKTRRQIKENSKLQKIYERKLKLFTAVKNLQGHVDNMSGSQKFFYKATSKVFRIGHFMGHLSDNITNLALASPYLFYDPSRFALTFANQLITTRAVDYFYTHIIDNITNKVKQNFIKSTLGKSLIHLATRFGSKRLAAWGLTLLAGAPSGGLSLVIMAGFEVLFALNNQLRLTERLKDLALAALIGLGSYVSGLSLGGLIGGAIGSLGLAIGGAALGFSIGGPIGAGIGFVLGGIGGFFLGSKIGEILAPSLGLTAGPSLAPLGAGGGLGGAAASTAAIEGPLASLAPQGIGAAVTTLGVGGLTVSLITSSAFFVPYQGGPSPWTEQSTYVKAVKAVVYNNQPLQSGQNLSKVNQGDVFTYTVQITATQSKLTSVRLKDTVQTTQASGSHLIKSFQQTKDEISPGTPWSISYPISVDDVSLFQNSIFSNTLAVTADVPDQNLTNEQYVASITIIIGQPPENCPYLWPVRGRRQITQGPNCTPCLDEPNCFCSHEGEQAIDIGDTPVGTPVFSTHTGTANFDFDTKGCKGNYVTITSVCNNNPFSTVYAHLDSFAPNLIPGQTVSANQLVGYSGNSAKSPKCSTGPHLHYATWGLTITDYLKSQDGLIAPNCGRKTISTCGFTPE